MKLQEALDSIDDAIAVATSSLGLLPGVAFQARVLQLAHLSNAHKSVSETEFLCLTSSTELSSPHECLNDHAYQCKYNALSVSTTIAIQIFVCNIY